jgi:hypothetical protein
MLNQVCFAFPEGSEFVAELGLLSGQSFRQERPYWRECTLCNLVSGVLTSWALPNHSAVTAVCRIVC